MKIRMLGRAVRLRLTRSEVARFAETGSVEECVPFPSMPLRYRLLRSDVTAADFSQGMLTVSVSEAHSRAWTDSAETGIRVETFGLELLIEQDFQCTHGPSDPDAFEPEAIS